MFTLDTVVPWGRSFDEYRRMFALGEAELRRRILGVADGPASFNAQATAGGLSVEVVATDGDESLTPTHLIRQADHNLYLAKSAGRNQLVS